MNFVKQTAADEPRAEAGSYTLVHLSDLHCCRPEGSPRACFFNKRLLSWLSWRLHRRHRQRPRVAEALVRAVARLDADQIVVTGDLTQLGLRAEFEAALGVLKTLGPPAKVMAVPGNHDALVEGAWRQGASVLADYLATDVSGRPPGFPALRVHRRTALIGLATARPSRPLLAVGSLGRAQLEGFAHLLQRTAADGLFRVVLIHHPPLPRAVSPHKRLTDLTALRAVLAAYGAELILHGHTHRRMRGTLPGPGGPIPVLGISAAGAGGRGSQRRAAFRVFRIETGRGRDAIRFGDRVFNAATGEFEPEAAAAKNFC